MRFKAFLSYSHEDNTAIAAALQRGLHRFARRWNRVRAMRVFRDRTTMGASADLWSDIRAALDESEFLILLASPGAAASDGVKMELTHWLEHRSPGKILIGVTGGEIVWSDRAGDFDWTRTTALPGFLKGVFRREPLHVDLRWWAEEGQPQDLRNFRLLDPVAEFASAIQGVPKDDLIGQDVEERRKFARLQRRVIGAAGLAGLLIVALSVIAWNQSESASQKGKLARVNAEIAKKKQEEAEKNAALERQQKALADSRELARLALLGRSNRERIELAIQAVETADTEAAVKALRSVLSDHLDAIEQWGRESPLLYDRKRSVAAVEPRHPIIALASPYGGSVVQNVGDGSRFELCGSVEPIENLWFSPDGRYLLAERAGEGMEIWEVSERKKVGEAKLAARSKLEVFFAPDSTVFLTRDDDGAASLWVLPSGRHASDVKQVTDYGDVVFSPNSSLLFAYGGALEPSASLWSTRSGKRLWPKDPMPLTWGRFVRGGKELIGVVGGSRETYDVYRWRIGADGVPVDPHHTPIQQFDFASIQGEPGDVFLGLLKVPPNVTCSPDPAGRYLFCPPEGKSTNALVYDLSAGDVKRALPGWPLGAGGWPGFSRDGARVAVGSDGLAVWERPFDRPPWQLPGYFESPRFSGDGKRLFATDATGISAVDVAERKLIRTMRLTRAHGPELLWVDEEGRRIIGRTKQVLTVWAVDQNVPLATLNLFEAEKQNFESNVRFLKGNPNARDLVAFARRHLNACPEGAAPRAQ